MKERKWGDRPLVLAFIHITVVGVFYRSVNIPWPEKGMGDAEYLLAFVKLVMPIAMEFSPDLVISK